MQEVAKEYADCISRSVLLDKLQKWKFANEERGYDTASDLVQEMIDLVKEQPSAPYQKEEQKEYCSTCYYYAPDVGTCVNGDSEHCADFRCLDDSCEHWKQKGE